MAVITFEQVSVQELDERLLDSIRAYFKKGEVRITITVEREDLKDLSRVDQLLERNKQNPFVARFEADFDFGKLADQVEQNDAFDLGGLFQQHKHPNPSYVSA
jgi:hypothetical protein